METSVVVSVIVRGMVGHITSMMISHHIMRVVWRMVLFILMIELRLNSCAIRMTVVRRMTILRSIHGRVVVGRRVLFAPVSIVITSQLFGLCGRLRIASTSRPRSIDGSVTRVEKRLRYK